MENVQSHEAPKNSTLKNASELMEEIESKVDTFPGSKEIAITTGFRSLDERIGGLRVGELSLLVGNKGIGKTAFLLSVVKHCILERPAAPILLADLEESSTFDIALRLVCSFSRMHPSRYMLGHWGTANRQRFLDAVATIKKAPIFFSDFRLNSIDELCATARTLGLGLLVIDSFEHICNDRGPRSFKLRQISIGRQLRALANELEIPVLCTATLSMTKGKRANRMGALRAKGIPASEADAILRMSEDKKERRWRRKYDDCTSSKTVNVQVLKSPNDQCDKIPLFWDENIHSLEERQETPPYQEDFEPLFPENASDESPSF